MPTSRVVSRWLVTALTVATFVNFLGSLALGPVITRSGHAIGFAVGGALGGLGALLAAILMWAAIPRRRQLKATVRKPAKMLRRWRM